MNTTKAERSFYIIYIREPALRPAITLHIMYHCITEARRREGIIREANRADFISARIQSKASFFFSYLPPIELETTEEEE